MEVAGERQEPAHRHGSARRGLLRLRRRLAFHLVLAAFCAVSLGWSLAAGALHHLLPRRAGTALGQWAIMRGFRLGLWLMRAGGLARFELGPLDALAAEGPMVIACNHLSLIDAVLVVSRLPRAVCIARSGLLDNPFLGGGARLAGYIRNDVPLTLVRAAVAALRDGRQLVIFPEGTRSPGPGLLPFRPGFTAMARLAGVPVQAVFLDSNTPYLRPGWPLRRMPAFPLHYRARRGPRVTVTGSATAAAAAIERCFAAELGRP